MPRLSFPRDRQIDGRIREEVAQAASATEVRARVPARAVVVHSVQEEEDREAEGNQAP